MNPNEQLNSCKTLAIPKVQACKPSLVLSLKSNVNKYDDSLNRMASTGTQDNDFIDDELRFKHN